MIRFDRMHWVLPYWWVCPYLVDPQDFDNPEPHIPHQPHIPRPPIPGWPGEEDGQFD